MLIDDGQPDGAQVKLAYPARDRIRRRGLLVGVQTMAGYEAMLANPVDQAAAELARRGVSHLANLRSGTGASEAEMTVRSSAHPCGRS